MGAVQTNTEVILSACGLPSASAAATISADDPRIPRLRDLNLREEKIRALKPGDAGILRLGAVGSYRGAYQGRVLGFAEGPNGRLLIVIRAGLNHANKIHGVFADTVYAPSSAIWREHTDEELKKYYEQITLPVGSPDSQERRMLQEGDLVLMRNLIFPQGPVLCVIASMAEEPTEATGYEIWIIEREWFGVEGAQEGAILISSATAEVLDMIAISPMSAREWNLFFIGLGF